eukprot:g636.t1
MTSPAFADEVAPDAGVRIVRVAICGGGVAGVSVAEALLKEYNNSTENKTRNNDTDVEDADEKTLPLPSNVKLEVHVFEMGRQLGGRCSTRRPRGFPQFRFDHGHHNEQENHCAAPCPLINPSVATPRGADYYVTPSYEVVVSSRRGSFGGPTLLQTKEEHQTKEPAAVPGGIPTIVVQDQEQDGGTRVIPAHKGSHLFVGPRMQQLFGAHYEAPWTLRRFMDDAEVGEKARAGKNEDAFNFDTPFDFVVGADRLFLSIKGGDICFSNRTTADFFEPLSKVLREEIGNLPVFSCMVAIRDKRAPDHHRSGSSEANTAPHALFHGMNFVDHPILDWASLENSKREDYNNLGIEMNMKNGNDQQVDTDTALFVVLSHAEWTKQRLEELESDVQFELEVQDYHGRYGKRHPLERGVEAQVVQPEVGGDPDAAASSKIQTYFEIYRDRCNQVCESEVYPAFMEELRRMYCAACTAGGEHQESQPFAERFEVVFLQCHRWGAAFPEIRPGFWDRLRKVNGIPSSSSAGASGGSASPGLRTDLRVRSQSQTDVKNLRSEQERPIRESQTDSWYSEKYQFGLCGDFFTTRPGRVLAAAHSGRALGRAIRKKIEESAANELQSCAAAASPSSSSSSSTGANGKKRIRGIIAPHAGYSFSGPTAAYSYHFLLEELKRSLGMTNITSTSKTKRIVVLHPSHHVYLGGIALSGARELQTVFGSLDVDLDFMTEVQRILTEANLPVSVMSQAVDTAEHSGEMHYPYVKYCIDRAVGTSGASSSMMNRGDRERDSDLPPPINIKVAVLMVGSLSAEQERRSANALSHFFLGKNDDNFFVVSSDFCHWGQRFDYYPTPPPNWQLFNEDLCYASTRISQYIEALDREAMALICGEISMAGNDEDDSRREGAGGPGRNYKNGDAFVRYLQRTGNTICGRHPISLFLFLLETEDHEGANGGGGSSFGTGIEAVHYAQSSQVEGIRDSSVSYVAMVARSRERGA